MGRKSAKTKNETTGASKKINTSAADTRGDDRGSLGWLRRRLGMLKK